MKVGGNLVPARSSVLVLLDKLLQKLNFFSGPSCNWIRVLPRFLGWRWIHFWTVRCVIPRRGWRWRRRWRRRRWCGGRRWRHSHWWRCCSRFRYPFGYSFFIERHIPFQALYRRLVWYRLRNLVPVFLIVPIPFGVSILLVFKYCFEESVIFSCVPGALRFLGLFCCPCFPIVVSPLLSGGSFFFSCGFPLF